MLSSIHPLGERARRNRWSLTVSAYVAGSAAGGLLVGALAALAGRALRAGIGAPPAGLTAALAAVAASGAAAWDLGVRRSLPPRRQVNEDWLGRYRGWVYGAGFGFQLGAGLTTIVTTATVPLTFVLSLLGGLAGGSWIGPAAGLVFGVTRAAPALLLRRVHEPAGLRRFHERMEAARPRWGA